MGQLIQVESSVVGDVAMFHTDRTITGQDGVSFSSADEASDDSFPAQLATELFGADPSVDHVFIASNQVVVRRAGGWAQAPVVRVASETVSRFFVHYDETTAAG